MIISPLNVLGAGQSGLSFGVIKVGSTLVTCTDTAEMTKVLEGSSVHVNFH